MPRLLLVTHFLPPHEGGIERVALDHARAAAAAGWAVTWVASQAPADTRRHETEPWGQAVRIPCWNGFERRFGVPYPVWGPGARARLEPLVAGADLVHVHDVLYPGTSIALDLARRLGRPTLLTQHVGFVPYRSRALEALERAAYATIGRRNIAQADAVAYLFPGVVDWLRESCGFTGNAIHLPHGVDTNVFRPARDAAEKLALRRKHGFPADRPIVLFVGRLVYKKGARLLLDALPDGLHLVLVGERGEVGLPSRPNVEQRPFAPGEVLAEWMRAADLLVQPSIGEGVTLVAQEAMASGLAVVLTADPRQVLMVDDGAAVFVAHERAALAAALAELAADPERRAGLGWRARENALRHWTTGACRERLLATYHELTATD